MDWQILIPVLDDVWLPYRKALLSPRMRLFCFPHAGGSASLFRRWQAQLPDDVEVCAAQLPGRERRFLEPPFSQLPQLADEIARLFRPTSVPFAFLGASMGAWISFELTRALRRRGAPLPEQLFVVASPAPHIKDTGREYAMSLDEWIEHASKLGELSPDELATRELLELMFPTIRADASITETHIYTDEPPLPVAISAFACTRDRRVAAADVRQWQRHTTAAFTFSELDREHNLLKTSPEPLIEAVATALRAH